MGATRLATRKAGWGRGRSRCERGPVFTREVAEAAKLTVREDPASARIPQNRRWSGRERVPPQQKEGHLTATTGSTRAVPLTTIRPQTGTFSWDLRPVSGEDGRRNLLQNCWTGVPCRNAPTIVNSRSATGASRKDAIALRCREPELLNAKTGQVGATLKSSCACLSAPWKRKSNIGPCS